MSDLRNDYEQQSLKKQLSYKEYVNSTLEDICGINPFILRTTILTENGNVYSNFVEDSLTQIKQVKKHIAYSRVGYKNEEYVPIHTLYNHPFQWSFRSIFDSTFHISHLAMTE